MARRRPQHAAPPPASPWASLWSLQTYYDGTARFFSAFGAFIATHQTLSLLTTGLIICSLLSPAIILTFSPSGSIFDISASAITRRGRGELVWELAGMSREGLISTEEDVCWDRVQTYYEKTGRHGGGRRIRVEQVLVSVVGAGSTAHRGSIGKGLLHRTWRIQHELERRLLAADVGGNDCLRLANGRCAVLSPVGWWASEDELLRDRDIHRTLSQPPVRAEAAGDAATLALPLTVSDTMVGAGRDRHGVVKTAQHLVISFFLDDGPSLPSSISTSALPSNSTALTAASREIAIESWRRTVHDVLDHKGWPGSTSPDPFGLATESKIGARHVLLKFFPHLVTGSPHPRRLENLVYGIGYLLVAFYVWRYIGKLRAHSKMGLLVTGIVELAASGIMSVSICWLMGWGLGLVPWNLLAFLVLTSGLDNMIIVLRAIADTDIHLPVPQRMSAGLKAVGVEMSILLLVDEIMALGLLWWVDIAVMREWIRFGAVVLVVDYFLELTFFSTVLSIDIQRLELADILAQNTAVSYQPVSNGATEAKDAGTSSWSVRNAGPAAWKILRQRPAKTTTVALLWFLNVFLYAFYGSEHYLPAACSHTALTSDRPFLSPSFSPSNPHSLRVGRNADPAASLPSDVRAGSGAAFWNLVNPSNATSVQVYLEPPVSIQFFSEDALTTPESLDYLVGGAHDSSSSLFTKLAVLLLPIAVVMGLLYLLLLYLLKDAELLQAHWGSEERLGGPTARKRRSFVVHKGPEAGVEVEPALNAQHDGDLELVASGGDIVVSWAALETRLQVRRQEADGAVAISSLDLPVLGEPISLVALAVDSHGRYVAAATARGRVLVWSLERGGGPLNIAAPSPSSPSTVISLVVEAGTPLIPPRRTTREPSLSTPAPPTSSANRATTPDPPAACAFYSLHRDGSIVRWDPNSCTSSAIALPDSLPVGLGDGAKRWLVSAPATLSGARPPLLALASSNGRLRLVSLALPGVAKVVFDLQAAQGGGAVARIAVGAFSVVTSDEAPQVQGVVAVASSSGTIAFYTLSTAPTRLGEPVDLGSRVRQIRLVDPPVEQACSACSDPLVDGFVALVSTRTSLRVLRVFTPPTSASLEPCACNTTDFAAIARSRSGSTVIGSPMMSRTLSSGGTSRRFSPRKKPATPSRPLQQPASSLGIELSPVRPRTHPQLSHESRSSDSSSGSHSPVHERTIPTYNSLAPPPPLALSAASSPHSSPPSSTIPLPASTRETSSRQDCAALPLRVVEVCSVEIDERGGWDVVTSARKAAGLRRQLRAGAHGESAPRRGWEIWSLSLGKDGGSFDDGFDLGTSDLARVLERGVDGNSATIADGSAPALGSTSSGLRQRRAPGGRNTSSKTSTQSRSASAAAADRLPFSRARPVVAALSGSVLSVGLGDQLVALRPTAPDPMDLLLGGLHQQKNGFLSL
ncbi:hypothetical protein Rhopal_001400-T1 [Rhodotorula paludigena]|uniref:Sterol regulatory element-binding protein cleavage-activating protein n=1 Tax=Rhodotorula paludigena TaxID=86838 RepID=A0AAV5GD82_9BASI|nr:hypothetical protein Rhopal_001400-T1 [Rhodotorula paludigena]